jgi:integrase
MATQSLQPASPVARYVAASRAPATARAYQADLRDFSEWCAQVRLSAYPASPDTVARYLAHLATVGAKVTTIQRRAVAISAAHKAAGVTNPVQTELVRKIQSGIRRAHGVHTAKKRALTLTDLRAMIEALPDTLNAIRDRAILTLLFAGAFRRGEVAALDRADVRLLSDEMVITLRRSKTDQSGAGLDKHIPLAADATICAVRAMRAWLAAGQITGGPVFRMVDRWGAVRDRAITGHTVALVVKAAARGAGMDVSDISGHSARRGFITAAYQAGQSEADIMEHTGHHSLVVMRGYRADSGAAQRRVVRAVLGNADG